MTIAAKQIAEDSIPHILGLDPKKECYMHVSARGLQALRQLRMELQESAGGDFPHSQLRELLLLYDVCKYLDLTTFQARDVLGVHGYTFVTTYINQPMTLYPAVMTLPIA